MANPPSSPDNRPDNRRAISAARLQPVPEAPRRVTGEMLRVQAKESVLNGAGILRDFWDDFKSSDRYFKYKAMVALLWLSLSVTSLGVACPSMGTSNSIGARLVVAGEARAPIFMVKNDSAEGWEDVEVLVNGKYRSTQGEVSANHEITLSPAVLYDEGGNRAPADLKISEISVRVGSGGSVSLLENGQPR